VNLATLPAPRSVAAPPARYAPSVAVEEQTLDDRVGVAFAAGDEAALKELYDATSRLVYSFCRRSVGPDAAADVTQEVYVAAWRSRERYRPEAGTLTGWVMGIAKYKVIDALRASGRRPQLDDGAEPEDHGEAEEGIEAMSQRMLIAEALSELPDRARQAVELAFWSDLTHNEISDRTGIPLGTVKSDIRRGLDRMRRHLESFDVSAA
jgi:RNA polymerase sigma-70 factor (ECF subfamily)